MTIDFAGLAALGWSNAFQAQLTSVEALAAEPVRVLAVHRNGLDVAGADLKPRRIPPVAAETEEDAATVGDWLLMAPKSHRPVRILDRKSLFKRRAAGAEARVQLIAANVDTLLVVTSCNADFNVARLERYLALAQEAGVTPIVVLTKADLVEDTSTFVSDARRLMPGLLVECVDARGAEAVAAIGPWCSAGQTVALVGSSGVGKSTLVNALSGTEAQATAPIREEDARGRHTTSGRSLHQLPSGGWLLDTPGMRELQLTDAAEGIAGVFADIVDLAATCRFANCRHESEPGCAVLAAVEVGDLEAERLARFRKLQREDAKNAEAIHERRAREKRFGKMVRTIKDKRS